MNASEFLCREAAEASEGEAKLGLALPCPFVAGR
jgi:hypothetical protein